MTNETNRPTSKRPVWMVALSVVVASIGWWLKQSQSPVQQPTTPSGQVESAGSSPRETAPDGLANAIRLHSEDVTVVSNGRVVKLLPDDTQGDRHQKLLVDVGDRQTILIAHNIDLASRIDVREGDQVEFKGQYIWNDRGGVVHWTHHDPGGRHPAGWVKVNGRTFD